MTQNLTFILGQTVAPSLCLSLSLSLQSSKLTIVLATVFLVEFYCRLN